MINAILVFNKYGNVRLTKFYTDFPEATQQKIIEQTIHLVLKRNDNMCNFIESDSLVGGPDLKLIYQHIGSLFFAFYADSSESELGILGLINIFVVALNKCFGTVRELDIIFHVDKVHYILNEVVMGGLIFETSVKEIFNRIHEQKELVAEEERNHT